MATPVGDSHQVASGGMIAAGRTSLSARTALVGDSLTEQQYEYSPVYWGNGLNGGKLKVVANVGVSGDRVGMMLSRIDNAYPSGLAGVGVIGRINFRGGTNDAADLTPIAPLAPTYTALLNKLAGYAGIVFVHSVPPRADGAINNLVIQYNAWLSAFVAASPTRFRWVDDCVNMRDGSNVQLTPYFIDYVHFSPRGIIQAGVDSATALSESIGSYPSPLAKSIADAYPNTPQWFGNPGMVGSAGVAQNGFTGQVVTGLTISGNPSGMAGNCTIIAADAGDQNQTPWQRVTPTTTSVGSSNSIRITAPLTGRTITAIDPVALDCAIEIRLNALVTQYIEGFKMHVQGASSAMTPISSLRTAYSLNQTKTAVLRCAIPRSDNAAQASATFWLEVFANEPFVGAMGSFDFRNITVRG